MSKHMRASILSSSSIEHCFASENSKDCETKLFISLTIENGQVKGTETAQFTYGNFTDTSRVVMSLESPLSLNVAKSQVKVMYRLKYLQSFPSQVFEKVINSVWPFCSEGLFTGDELEVDSTCGYAKDENDNPIPNSQGFCCSCPISTLLTGIRTKTTRGDCGFFSTSETAHCLRFSNTTYAGYSIEGYSYHYEITLDMKYKLASSSSYEEKSQVISVEKRTATNDFMTARIVGDYLPLTPPPELTNKILLLPSAQVEENISSNWLLVDRNMVTLDGSECNKIGTSYSAFQNQSNKCGVEAGTCLSNQIDDILNQESNRQSAGVATRHLLKGFGDFTRINEEGDNIHLEMNYKEIFTTHVAIEIKADGLTFITQLGKASIESLEINDFEALKSTGKLKAEIKNKGQNNANFQVRLDCSEFIQPVLEKSLSLKATEAQLVVFELYSTNPEDQSNTCTLKVVNARDKVVASEEVGFDTFALQETMNDTDVDESDKVIRDSADKQKIQFDSINEKIICMYLCPDISSAACFVVFGCANELKRMVYFIILMLVVIAGCLFIVYRCCGPKIFVCFICFFKKKKLHAINQEETNQVNDCETVKITPFTLKPNNSDEVADERVRMDLIHLGNSQQVYKVPEINSYEGENTLDEETDIPYSPLKLKFNRAAIYIKYNTMLSSTTVYSCGMRKANNKQVEFQRNEDLETALGKLTYFKKEHYSRTVDKFLKENLLEIIFD